MQKIAINLILQKQKEPLLIHRLKIILPIIAASSLVIFIFLFAFSLLYLNSNVESYNSLVSDVGVLEGKVRNQTSTEGTYLYVESVSDMLQKLLEEGKRVAFVNILEHTQELNVPDTNISAIHIDGKGTITLNLTSKSVDSLDILLQKLKGQELDQKIISEVKAQSIQRDKKGIYALTITYKEVLTKGK